MLIERPIIVRSTTRPIFEADAGRAERIARSVSVVGDQVGASENTFLFRFSLFDLSFCLSVRVGALTVNLFLMFAPGSIHYLPMISNTLFDLIVPCYRE